MAIGIFILQMVQAWYILLNACSICTMKIPSTTMKIALSYICILYVYICTTSTTSLYSRTMPRAVLALFSSIRLSYLVYTSYLKSFS